MNRDIKDILYVDFDENKAAFHKENVLVLPRWEGDLNDRELYDILPFLESTMIFINHLDLSQTPGVDVRKEL